MASDETFLTKYSGDKNMWPMYMSVLNIPATIRNKPTTESWRLLATLPIRSKNTKNSESERVVAAEVFQTVLSQVLGDVGRLYKEGMKIDCPDGIVRIGHPVVGEWLADYPEYTKLFGVLNKYCPACITPLKSMASPPTTSSPPRTIDVFELRTRLRASQQYAISLQRLGRS